MPTWGEGFDAATAEPWDRLVTSPTVRNPDAVERITLRTQRLPKPRRALRRIGDRVVPSRTANHASSRTTLQTQRLYISRNLVSTKIFAHLGFDWSQIATKFDSLVFFESELVGGVRGSGGGQGN